MQLISDEYVNIDEVQDLMCKSREEMKKFQQIEFGILILGTTGTGKSTLTNGFSGIKTQKFFDDRTGKWKYKSEGIAVGYGSMTKIPRLVKKQNLKNNVILCDCPGFSDTKGYGQEIVNSFCNMMLIKKIQQIKIIFAVTESSITDNHGDGFVKSINNFTKMFKDVEFLEKSVCICITQCDKYKQIKHMKNDLQDIYDNNKIITRESKKILQYVFSNQKGMSILYKADDSSNFNFENLFQEIDSSIEYVQMDPFTYKNLRIAIGSEAQIFANKFFQSSFQNLIKYLSQIEKQILDFSGLMNKQYTQENYFQVYEKRKICSLEEILMYFGFSKKQLSQQKQIQTHSIIQNIENKILLMKDIDAVQEQIETLIKAQNLETINLGIIKIFQILQKYESEDNQFQELSFLLDEILLNLEFVMYFQQVCTKSIVDYMELNQVFELIRKSIISERDQTQILINMIKEDQSFEYYTQIQIFLSDPAYQKQQYKNIQAKSFFYIGLLEMKKNQLFDSSKNFIEAIVLSNFKAEHLENIYVLLAYNFYNEKSRIDELLKDQKLIIYQIFEIYKKQLVQTMTDLCTLIENDVLCQIPLLHYDHQRLQNITKVYHSFKIISILPFENSKQISASLETLIEFINSNFILNVINLPQNDFYDFECQEFKSLKIQNAQEISHSFKTSIEGICSIQKLMVDKVDYFDWYCLANKYKNQSLALLIQNISNFQIDVDQLVPEGYERFLESKLDLINLLPNNNQFILIKQKVYLSLANHLKGKDNEKAILNFMEYIEIQKQIDEKKELLQLNNLKKFTEQYLEQMNHQNQYMHQQNGIIRRQQINQQYLNSFKDKIKEINEMQQNKNDELDAFLNEIKGIQPDQMNLNQI